MIEIVNSPGPLFSIAAFCKSDFDEFLDRTGAKPLVSEMKSFGKVVDTTRMVFLKLEPRRFAALSKYDSQEEFEIGLQIVGSTFYSHELELVSEFIGCAPGELRPYRSPPTRWAEDKPDATDLDRWRAKLGFAYPY